MVLLERVTRNHTFFKNRKGIFVAVERAYDRKTATPIDERRDGHVSSCRHGRHLMLARSSPRSILSLQLLDKESERICNIVVVKRVTLFDYLPPRVVQFRLIFRTVVFADISSTL